MPICILRWWKIDSPISGISSPGLSLSPLLWLSIIVSSGQIFFIFDPVLWPSSMISMRYFVDISLFWSSRILRVLYFTRSNMPSRWNTWSSGNSFQPFDLSPYSSYGLLEDFSSSMISVSIRVVSSPERESAELSLPSRAKISSRISSEVSLSSWVRPSKSGKQSE